MKFALIPDGEVWMGSPDEEKDAHAEEKPRHRARITQPFYLGIYEVTQARSSDEAVIINPSFRRPEKVAGRSTRVSGRASFVARHRVLLQHFK